VGVGQLVYIVFAVFKVLVVMGDLGDVPSSPAGFGVGGQQVWGMGMGDLGDVAIESRRFRGWWSASAGNGHGSMLTLGPWVTWVMWPSSPAGFGVGGQQAQGMGMAACSPWVLG